jgi:DNA-directed RNA polymerase subunit RPC12/RpoP
MMSNDIHLIPDKVPCPHCGDMFPAKPALYLLSMYAWIYCTKCSNRITKEDIGPYLGVIKDVKNE